MKIYSVTLELYTNDHTNPDQWNWDDMIKKWNVKDLNSILIACERRYDLESTIPSSPDSDTEPPNSDI